MQIASHLGYTDDSFSTSNGWLKSWKRRHNVKQVALPFAFLAFFPEFLFSQCLPKTTSFIQIPHIFCIISNYNFWELLFPVSPLTSPASPLTTKGEHCFYCKCNRWKPIVIWKSENSRCFKNVDKTKLPVQYFSQSNAWMSGEIMDTILKK